GGMGVPNELRVAPPKEDTVRGVTANIIICEEAACLPGKFFSSIVIPLLQVNGTTLLSISTIRDAENYYTRLLDSATVAKKRSSFSILKIFSVCAKCRESGIAKNCKHMESEQPEWMSSSRAEQVTELYEITKTEDLLHQEIF